MLQFVEALTLTVIVVNHISDYSVKKNMSELYTDCRYSRAF